MPEDRMFSITEQVSRRFAIGVCFAQLASGCDGGGSPVHSTPPNSSVTAPSNPLPTGTNTITGTVVDESGRPIAGASPDFCCFSGNTYSHWHVPNVLLT